MGTGTNEATDEFSRLKNFILGVYERNPDPKKRHFVIGRKMIEFLENLTTTTITKTHCEIFTIMVKNLSENLTADIHQICRIFETTYGFILKYEREFSKWRGLTTFKGDDIMELLMASIEYFSSLSRNSEIVGLLLQDMKRLNKENLILIYKLCSYIKLIECLENRIISISDSDLELLRIIIRQDNVLKFGKRSEKLLEQVISMLPERSSRTEGMYLEVINHEKFPNLVNNILNASIDDVQDTSSDSNSDDDFVKIGETPKVEPPKIEEKPKFEQNTTRHEFTKEEIEEYSRKTPKGTTGYNLYTEMMRSLNPSLNSTNFFPKVQSGWLRLSDAQRKIYNDSVNKHDKELKITKPIPVFPATTTGEKLFQTDFLLSNHLYKDLYDRKNKGDYESLSDYVISIHEKVAFLINQENIMKFIMLNPTDEQTLKYLFASDEDVLPTILKRYLLNYKIPYLDEYNIPFLKEKQDFYLHHLRNAYIELAKDTVEKSGIIKEALNDWKMEGSDAIHKEFDAVKQRQFFLMNITYLTGLIKSNTISERLILIYLNRLSTLKSVMLRTGQYNIVYERERDITHTNNQPHSQLSLWPNQQTIGSLDTDMIETEVLQFLKILLTHGDKYWRVIISLSPYQWFWDYNLVNPRFLLECFQRDKLELLNLLFVANSTTFCETFLDLLKDPSLVEVEWDAIVKHFEIGLNSGQTGHLYQTKYSQEAKTRLVLDQTLDHRLIELSNSGLDEDASPLMKIFVNIEEAMIENHRFHNWLICSPFRRDTKMGLFELIHEEITTQMNDIRKTYKNCVSDEKIEEHISNLERENILQQDLIRLSRNYFNYEKNILPHLQGTKKVENTNPNGKPEHPQVSEKDKKDADYRAKTSEIIAGQKTEIQKNESQIDSFFKKLSMSSSK